MLSRGLHRQIYALTVLVVPLMSGCLCFKAIPPHCVRPNILDAPKANQEPVNFLRLRQDPPEVYLLGPRDILGVYVEGVLGESEGAPPVHFPEDPNVPPAIGYPMPVREDGTLSLPLVQPLPVGGLSLAQAERLIRKAYTVDNRILQPGRDRIIVTLMKPRTYEVLVVREDSTTVGAGGGAILGSTKKGQVYKVELRAYQNDVLHALAESGGLPGVDAKNELTILRGEFADAGGINSYFSMFLQNPEAFLASQRLVRPVSYEVPTGGGEPAYFAPQQRPEAGYFTAGKPSEPSYFAGARPSEPGYFAGARPAAPRDPHGARPSEPRLLPGSGQPEPGRFPGSRPSEPRYFAGSSKGEPGYFGGNPPADSTVFPGAGSIASGPLAPRQMLEPNHFAVRSTALSTATHPKLPPETAYFAADAPAETAFFSPPKTNGEISQPMPRETSRGGAAANPSDSGTARPNTPRRETAGLAAAQPQAGGSGNSAMATPAGRSSDAKVKRSNSPATGGPPPATTASAHQTSMAGDRAPGLPKPQPNPAYRMAGAADPAERAIPEGVKAHFAARELKAPARLADQKKPQESVDPQSEKPSPRTASRQQIPGAMPYPMAPGESSVIVDPNVIKIPLRTWKGNTLDYLREEDIILQNGDIIFIESRDAEVFYTGGLLAGGQHKIPRDYDLDVLSAISMAGSSLAISPAAMDSAGGGGGGSIRLPPTKVTVLRMTDGQQTVIRTTICRMLRDPSARILVQPNDYILLEYTSIEFVANLFLGNIQFNYFLNDWGG